MKNKIIALLCIFVFLVIFPGAGRGYAANAPAIPAVEEAAVMAVSPGYLAIPAAAFYPTKENGDYENHGRYLKAFSPGDSEFRAAVNLPQGAVVTKVSACFYEDSTTATARVNFLRTLVGDGMTVSNLAPIESADSGGYILRTDNEISYATINNSAYAYHIQLNLPQSTGADNDVWACGVFITYTPPAAETGVLSLSGAAFRPWVDGYNSSTNQVGGLLIHYSGVGGSSSNGSYMAQLNLPDGATVQALEIYYSDNRPDKAAVAWLQRCDAYGTYENMASVSSADGFASSYTEAISNGVIDNLDHSYWVLLDMPQWTSDAQIYVDSVQIRYTLPVSGRRIISISNAAFTGFHDDYDYENHVRWLYHLQGTGGSSADGVYLAPVYLPHGAKVAEFKAHFYDGSNTLTGTAHLVRARLGVNQTLNYLNSWGDSGYTASSTIAFNDYELIDNSQYAYYVYWDVPVNTLPTPPNAGDVLGVRVTITLDSRWKNVDGLNTERMSHSATLLPNGRVLVAGGRNTTSGVLKSAEIYNPATNQWLGVASMIEARYNHTALLLADGRVLVVGGENTSGELKSVEYYDYISNRWTTAASMKTARIDHTTTLLEDGRVLVTGGYNSVSEYLRSAEIYDPQLNAWSSIPNMLISRDGHTATLTPTGDVLVAGGSNGGGTLKSAEIFDPDANSWTLVEDMHCTHGGHTATLLTNQRQVLVAGGTITAACSTEIFNPADGSWNVMDEMNILRFSQTAHRLADGRVMIIGGYALDSVEIYDPAADAWTVVDEMHVDRSRFASTLLPDGQVLVVGGDGGGPPSEALDSTEVYDPAAPSWSPAGNLNTARSLLAGTLLLNGKALVVGGRNYAAANPYLNSAELYDPATDVWSATISPMNTQRYSPSVTLMPDGRALIVGGKSDLFTDLSSVEMYDPDTNTFTSVTPMHAARVAHTATLLEDGRVFVAGGWIQSNAEIYDPARDAWTEIPPMAHKRFSHSATLLPDGRVLVVGGKDSGDYGLSTVEIYDPVANTWTEKDAMDQGRFHHTATLLPSGDVLVVGGESASGAIVWAEIYDVSADLWSTVTSLSTARENHTATLLPSGEVLVMGGENSIALGSAEIYNPGLDIWTPVANLSVARSTHIAVLLPSGKVLAVGGGNDIDSELNSAEIWDPGLGFSQSWRPALVIPPVQITLSWPFSSAATGLRGYGLGEASGGGKSGSASNYPLVQVRRLDSEQVIWLKPNSFEATSYLSRSVSGILPGPAMVTVFVNGIPSVSCLMNVANLSKLYLPLLRR